MLLLERVENLLVTLESLNFHKKWALIEYKSLIKVDFNIFFKH